MRRLLFVLFAALAIAPMAGAWTWPVDGLVLQVFSFDPLHPYAAGQHRGIDIGGEVLLDCIPNIGRVFGDIDRRRGMQTEMDPVPLACRAQCRGTD